MLTCYQHIGVSFKPPTPPSTLLSLYVSNPPHFLHSVKEKAASVPVRNSEEVRAQCDRAGGVLPVLAVKSAGRAAGEAAWLKVKRPGAKNKSTDPESSSPSRESGECPEAAWDLHISVLLSHVA